MQVIIDTISVTKYGHSYLPTYPVSEANGVELRRIIAVLSMPCSGFFVLVRRGVIPPDYGKGGTVHQRFIRWRRKGIWGKLLDILVDEPDFEWLMIDASHVKVHPDASGAVGANQNMERTKVGSTLKSILPWMRMVCQSESLLRMVPEQTVKKQSI